jgi:hypothetical protein
MKKILTLCLAVALASGFTSCTKEGPAGPAGATGNANVHSKTITINPSEWYQIGTQGSSGDGYRADKADADITSAIVNSGAVLAYISSDNTTWFSLPQTAPFATWSESINILYSTGTVSVVVQDSDFLTVAPGTPLYLKVVTVASSGMVEHSSTDWSNYEEVSALYNLD